MTVKMGHFERIKYLMITFNILISLSGCLLLAAPFLLLLHPIGLSHVLSVHTMIFAGTICFTALCGVLLILGILGSVAAFLESRCLLIFFFFVILLVFVVELGAGISAFLFRFQLTREYFDDDLINYYTGDNVTGSYSSNSNSIMISFECCGVSGPKDFSRTLHFVILNPLHEVPEACCKRRKATPDGDIYNLKECISGNIDLIHNKGCFDLISSQVEIYLYVIGALSIWILIMKILVMIFAIWLYQRV
ncbi:tetraspanin-18B-like [Heterodontus francisci]|uniref:tetraspanin-18B-like n=1 Tax=Heterodontus francisci TaxID=7792 RepID=UPI00355BF8A1